MIYNVVIANPAGNITAFVLDDVQRSDYPKIANALMRLPNYDIEQVGFITSPTHANTKGRFEMMGGEFCANASRSFGLYLAQNGITDDEFYIEVSGTTEPIKTFVDVKNSTAGIELKVDNNISELEYNDQKYPVVHLDGIDHILVFEHSEDADLVNELIAIANKKYNESATGVMFLNRSSMTMVPYVYVADTDSLIKEGSCGSGTIASALYMCIAEKKDYCEYDIAQPSGSISASIKVMDNDLNVRINGMVSLFTVQITI